MSYSLTMVGKLSVLHVPPSYHGREALCAACPSFLAWQGGSLCCMFSLLSMAGRLCAACPSSLAWQGGSVLHVGTPLAWQGGMYAQRYTNHGREACMRRGTPTMGERLPYAQRRLPMGERLPYAQRLLLTHGREASLCAEAPSP